MKWCLGILLIFAVYLLLLTLAIKHVHGKPKLGTHIEPKNPGSPTPPVRRPTPIGPQPGWTTSATDRAEDTTNRTETEHTTTARSQPNQVDRLAALMNYTKSKDEWYTCGNFYDYACANYDSLVEEFGKEATLGGQQKRFMQEIVKMLREEIDASDALPTKMVKSYFQKCESFYNQSSKDHELLKQFPYWPFPSIEGGPVTSECDDWTITDVVTQFMAIGFDVFDIKVIVSEETLEPSVYIGYDTETLLKFFNVEETAEKAIAVLRNVYQDRERLLDAVRQIKATVKDVLSTESSEEVSEPDVDNEPAETKIVLRDLLEGMQEVDPHKQLDIRKMLHFKYPDVEFEEDTVVAIPSKRNLFLLAKVVLSIEKKNLANLIVLSFLSKLKDRPSNGCLVNALNYMGLATLQMMGKVYWSDSDYKNIRSIFENVANEFQATLLNAKWLSKPIQAIYLEKLQDLKQKFYIGFPDIVLEKNHGELEKFYSNLGDDFIDADYNEMQNLLIRLKWHIDFKILETQNRDLTYHLADYAPQLFNINAFYYPLNLIVAKYQYLTPTRYHSSYPVFLQYASIGFILSHELLHAFTEKYLRFDKNYKNITETIRETDPEAWKQIVLSEACYENQFSFYKMRISTQVKDLSSKCKHTSGYLFHLPANGKKTLSENMPDTDGLKIAFQAYKKWKSLNPHDDADFSLKGFENYSLDQQFFIALAYQWCGKPLAENNYVSINGEHSPSRVRLTGMLENSPEFDQAFPCISAKGTKSTCSLWYA